MKRKRVRLKDPAIQAEFDRLRQRLDESHQDTEKLIELLRKRREGR